MDGCVCARVCVRACVLLGLLFSRVFFFSHGGIGVGRCMRLRTRVCSCPKRPTHCAEPGRDEGGGFVSILAEQRYNETPTPH
jgi:hypothetical protein